MAALTKRWILVNTVLVAGALVVSGCSAAEKSRSSTSPRTAMPSRTSRPPLTAEQLKALALKASEVPGAHSAPIQDPVPKSEQRTFPPVSDASCQTARDVLGADTASAVVNQIFNWKGDIWGGGSTLASYEGTKAQAAFSRLQDSLKTCRSFTGVGWTGKFSARITVDKAPDVGDGALSFHERSQLPDGGGLRDEHHVFVRVGNTTADFEKLNVRAKAKFPLALVEKQVDRLSSAQHD
ncbi:hypothetical protein ACWGI9_39460 [Streptomyces sp. NPDC054833]